MIKIAEHKNCFCPCMSVLDSGFPTPWFPDSRYYISHSLSVELGFRIPTISGIQDSLSCIPDFKDQDSGTHNKKIAPNSECEFPKTGQFLLLVKFQLLPVSTGACEFMPFYFDFFYMLIFHQDKCQLISKGRSLIHRNILEVMEHYRLTLNCRDLSGNLLAIQFDDGTK